MGIPRASIFSQFSMGMSVSLTELLDRALNLGVSEPSCGVRRVSVRL